MVTTTSTDTVAEDFRAALLGKMDAALLEESVGKMKSAKTKYPANGSVIGTFFYFRFTVSVTGGEKFTGNAGGLGSVAGGALFGDVYTENIDRLYRDTVSFSFVATPVYVTLQFFDSSSNFLGHYQAGAVSTIVGTGGGSGGWS